MAWIVPVYSREQINIAGRTRIDDAAASDAKQSVLGIVSNWRSSHSFPLNSFQMTLRHRAARVDSKAIVAQRLKRLSSMEIKLRRYPQMKLSQMQDIGGCRAVVRNIGLLDTLVDFYKLSLAKNPRGRHEFVSEDDYVMNPKDDGYRGVHLIYRYHSQSKIYSKWNQLKVEIQLRTAFQHSWATAVETVDMFTGDHLKTGTGDAQWGRFFTLMGTAIALREHKPVVPSTTSEFVEELRYLSSRLRVKNTFIAWGSAIQYLPLETHAKDAHYFLLHLDTKAGKTLVTAFSKDHQLEAQQAYAEAESKTENIATSQAVLVSVDKISVLRAAYPNYWLDTSSFRSEVERAIK